LNKTKSISSLKEKRIKRLKTLKKWLDNHSEFEVYRAYREKAKWNHSISLQDLVYYLKAKKNIEKEIEEYDDVQRNKTNTVFN